ncbi:hypothetical protein AZSI13_11800 [Azospira sp. I13]|uniref:DUF748 domain-containing protein n=1 Tax=Azospira sp. I13 TaxID=1765050 RepID=UPI000D414FB4|nr:DUF748 domain-containing protein [Azospira sp. I13]GBG01853.1 hypothetical protein AZSI13_11800 [Azospira sp. I13]
MTRTKHWLSALLILALALAALAVGGLHFGARLLKDQVQQALGNTSEIGEIRLAWDQVEIRGLRLKAPQGWPVEDTLRAERIIIRPDLRSLLGPSIRVASIRIEGAYLSALRTPEGKLRVVPSLLERPTAAEDKKSAPPRVEIGRIELTGAALEFFDTTVRKPALKLRLEQLDATVQDLVVPDLNGRTKLQLAGLLKGVRQDGRIAVQGWMDLATQDSDLSTTLRQVDLVALQPYLIKAAETGVKKGSLDLDLHAVVKDHRLKAPGTLVLNGLELDTSGSTFMGMPRQAVLGLLKDKNGRIDIKFVLEGNLKDPQFHLNESFATKIGASIADTFGISIEGLAKGVGTVGRKTMEAAGSAAQGVGKALKGLFSQ